MKSSKRSTCSWSKFQLILLKFTASLLNILDYWQLVDTLRTATVHNLTMDSKQYLTLCSCSLLQYSLQVIWLHLLNCVSFQLLLENLNWYRFMFIAIMVDTSSVDFTHFYVYGCFDWFLCEDAKIHAMCHWPRRNGRSIHAMLCSIKQNLLWHKYQTSPFFYKITFITR